MIFEMIKQKWANIPELLTLCVDFLTCYVENKIYFTSYAQQVGEILAA
jgi:hypothetical protein